MPLLGSPVNHTVADRWPKSASRSALVTRPSLRTMLRDTGRRPKLGLAAPAIMPAATVALVSRSMSTNEPVARLAL